MTPFPDELPNAEAEESMVIGAVMINPELIDQLAGLSSRDFYLPAKRSAFEAILALHKAGEEITPISIHYAARDLGKEVEVVDLSSMLDDARGVTLINRQVKMIRDAAIKRRIVKIAASLQAGAMNGKTPHELIQAADLEFATLKEAATSDRAKVPLTSLDDLLAEPEEEISWAVDGLFPLHGIGLMASKPKVGKTMTALNMVLAVSRGDQFLGRATHKGPAVYFDFEGKRGETRQTMARMGGDGANVFFYFARGLPPPLVVETATRVIQEIKPVVVVFDTIVHALGLPDLNSYGEVTLALRPFLDLARAFPCHLLLLHHNGKGGDTREAGDAVMGSTAFYGIVDTLVTLRKRESKARTIESSQRYGEDLPETIIHLDPETGIVSPRGDMKEFTLNERKKAVLDSMSADPIPETAIKEIIGGNGGLTSKAVRALFDEGRLSRTGNGRKGDPFLYSLPSVHDLPDEMFIPAGATDAEIDAICSA